MPCLFARHRSHVTFAFVTLALILGVSVLAPAMARAADSHQFDPAHTSVTFKS